MFLHNLQRYIFLSAGLKEVFIKFKMFTKENILEKKKKRKKKKKQKKKEITAKKKKIKIKKKGMKK